MQYIFLGILVICGLMWAAAQLTLEDPVRRAVERQIDDADRAEAIDVDALTVLTWSTDPNPARRVQSEVFLEHYPGLAVVRDPGDMTKLIVRAATGTGPDIIDTWSAAHMATLVEAGILLDLTPYAEQMGIGPDATYPAMADGLMYEGRQYRFPCNVWASTVIYNKRLFDELNLPYPQPEWTYEQLGELAVQIRERSAAQGRRIIPVANWENTIFFEDLLAGHGATLFDADGLRSTLDHPEAIAALQTYQRLMFHHRALPPPAEMASLASQGGWGAGGLNLFFSERAAMIFIGRWVTVMLPDHPDLDPANLATVTVPRAGNRPPQVVGRARGAAINAASPNREAALAFLQYLASEEYGQLIVNDGDGLPPNPNLARDGDDLTNTLVPEAGFHDAFITALETSRSLDLSPFIEIGTTERILRDAVEYVENGRDPETVLHAAADEINQRIRQNLRRRPDLQRKFEQVTGQPYTERWWTSDRPGSVVQ